MIPGLVLAFVLAFGAGAAGRVATRRKLRPLVRRFLPGEFKPIDKPLCVTCGVLS